jgi:23S rRNA pseudouridine2605 synthase
MAKQNFDKFINKEVKGAKKKEQIKQEKKLVKKEREAYFIEKKREQRAIKKLQEEQQNQVQSDKKKKRPTRESKSGGPGITGNPKPSRRSENPKEVNRERSTSREKPDFKSKTDLKNKPSEKFSSKKDWNKEDKRERPEKPALEKKESSRHSSKTEIRESQTAKIPPIHNKREETPGPPGEKRIKAEKVRVERPILETRTERPKPAFKEKPYTEKPIIKQPAEKPANKPAAQKPSYSPPVERPVKTAATPAAESQMPLNKYIAHCGICSRRDAGEIVKSGKVAVNGEKVTDPGTKVSEGDTVTMDGKKLQLKQTLVYILLNKPKDYITTADDPQGRKTVLDIVRNATPERIFPVGRLDRNTSGVLLLTNDGDLAQQLTHPSYEVRKIYEAKLDKALTKADFTKLTEGVTLEDGFVQADSVAYADSKDKSIIGIEIHSGRNRVVRRMFEHLGYDVRALDRVMFANLTKKNVDRGKWRFLNDKEVRLLKFFKSAKR